MDESLSLSTSQIVNLCHRQFGIGSDGIILLEPHIECDYDMVFFNPDASQSFCGNGSRCALHFASSEKIITDSATFNAIDGIHTGIIDGDLMKIKMNDVQQVEVSEDYYFLNTGSPHYVTFVEDVESLDVFNEGQKIRYNKRFKDEGTNVNFVKISDGQIHSRVYERGVENETYSSGTGTTAVAICAYLHQPQLGNRLNISTKGGTIKVDFNDVGQQRFEDIWLIGNVVNVYSGEIDV